MGLQSCSTFVKVGLLLCILALLFTCSAVFSPNWLINDQLKTSLGVFYKCTDGDCRGGGSTEREYCMDGRMDGWMDGWMDGSMDGWMDGWIDGWMD